MTMKKLFLTFLASLFVGTASAVSTTVSSTTVKTLISHSTATVQPGATLSVAVGRIDNLITPSTGTQNFGTVNASTGNFGVVTSSSLMVNVKSFGAKGDGVTNDATAIQNAENSIVNSSVSATLFFPAGTYKVNSGLTVNVGLVSVFGTSVKLDFTSLQSGSAITFVGSSANLYAGNPFYNADKWISGITVIGNASTGTVKGFDFTTAAEPGPSHFKIYNCNITQFGTGVNISTSAYILKFYGTDIWVCGTCVNIDNASNSGENILFSGGAWFNSDNGLALYNANADVVLDGMSIDGMHSLYIYQQAGLLSVSQTHFEGNFAPSYTTARVFWMPSYATANSNVSFNNDFFVIKSTRSVPVIGVDSVQYVQIKDCWFNTTASTSSAGIITTTSGGGLSITGTYFNTNDTIFTSTMNYWNDQQTNNTITTNKNLTITGIFTPSTVSGTATDNSTRTLSGLYTFNGGAPVKGTITGVNQSSGYAGFTSSASATNVPAGPSGQYVSISTSASLPAGRFLVTGCANISGTLVTATQVAVSAFSNNTTTDHVSGQNVLGCGLPSAAENTGTCISYIFNQTGSWNAYTKVQFTYSGGSPTASGSVTAIQLP